MESIELMPARVKITSILKKAILTGEYKSGQELSLTDTAERLGVSRTPVREAFQNLANEGFIELRMNKGAIVKPIDEKFIKDHYEMRILLEGEAVLKATQNHMDVTELLEKIDYISKHMNPIDKMYYNDLNQEIHTSIWEAADNQKLYNFLMSLWNGPSIGNSKSEMEHYEKSTQEHASILKNIQCGNGEEAKKIMVSHITRSMNNIITNFQEMNQ